MSGLGRGEFDFAFALNPEPDERAEAIARLENPWVIPTRRDGPIGDVEHPSFELIDRTDVVVWTRRWIGQLDLEEAWRRRGIAPADRLPDRRQPGSPASCRGRSRTRLPSAGFAAGGPRPSLTSLAPREGLSTRQTALCYPHHRQITGAVSALISAIRVHSTG